MTNDATMPGRYHALLIGIDAYEIAGQLLGCVSDIDSIQRILLERAKIPATHITRLASAHPTPERDSTVPPRPATNANLREALMALGSDMVDSDDRVFIYYAGHGTRVEVADADDDTSAFRGAQARWREALVPVDGSFDGSNLLYDFELNALLGRIAKRTQSVTMILDCCHSSGATRNLDGPGSNTRFMDFTRQGRTGPIKISHDQARLRDAEDRRMSSADPGSVDDCQIVAACQNHELANEWPLVVPEGETRSGLLTSSLVRALEEVPDEELTTVAWGRLWHRVRANIEAAVESDPKHLKVQNPWMSGGLARAWLGGPPNDGDVGFGLERVGDKTNEYLIRAGTIAGITAGARLAVYGDKPDKFPPLGTGDDEEALLDKKSRFTQVLLEVTEANVSEARAKAVGEPFDLPVGARGRLVQAGKSELVACAVVPEDSAITDALRESDLLEVTTDERALVRLERRDDGVWELTDDVHGARPGDPALASLAASEVVGRARPLLEQYVRYSGPLRFKKRCTDLPGALRIGLLACPSELVKENDIPNLPELATGIDGSFALMHQAAFCLRVRNTSSDDLKVSLFNSDPSGAVELLGEQTITGRADDHFWFESTVGAPFAIDVPEGQQQVIYRLVAIGTTATKSDLKHLIDNGSFSSSTREMRGATSQPPVAKWTAVEAIVRISRPSV